MCPGFYILFICEYFSEYTRIVWIQPIDHAHDRCKSVLVLYTHKYTQTEQQQQQQKIQSCREVLPTLDHTNHRQQNCRKIVVHK